MRIIPKNLFTRSVLIGLAFALVALFLVYLLYRAEARVEGAFIFSLTIMFFLTGLFSRLFVFLCMQPLFRRFYRASKISDSSGSIRGFLLSVFSGGLAGALTGLCAHPLAWFLTVIIKFRYGPWVESGVRALEIPELIRGAWLIGAPIVREAFWFSILGGTLLGVLGGVVFRPRPLDASADETAEVQDTPSAP